MITRRLIELAIKGNKYAIDRITTDDNPFKSAKHAVEQLRSAILLYKEDFPINYIRYAEKALYAIDNYEGQPLPWDYHGEKPLTTEYLDRHYGDCWRW